MATRAFMSQPMWTRSEGWPQRAEHEARRILTVAEPLPDGYSMGWQMYRGSLQDAPDSWPLGESRVSVRETLAEALCAFLEDGLQ